MRQRVTFLLRIYLWTILVFCLAKIAFMVSCHTGDLTITDLKDVLWHGLTLDLSTALYFLILPFLLTMVCVWWYRRSVINKVFYTYFMIISVAFALAFVADCSLYPFWRFKLDASCLQYLSSPNEAAASVSTGYLIIRLLILLATALFIFWGYVIPTRRWKNVTASAIKKTFETIFYILCIPLLVIGIRGGLGESTTNIGQVYFSQNQFLNHAAVNPVFSFLASFEKTANHIVDYHFYDDDECAAQLEGLYSTESIHSDTLLTTTRPNIVLIVLESCGGQFTVFGGHPDIMPYLNDYCHEGIYFEECYANSWRTDKGLVSILSGYPAFPITSVMKIPEKSRKLPSIARSLAAAGYENSFYYGGDINFTNMRSYVMGTGYQHIRWKADYPSDAQRSSKWGVRDDIMFTSLLTDIKQETAPYWMKTLMTLSSHEPWDVPTHHLDDEVYNAFNYLDSCLHSFIESLRKTPTWSNTLVVILPDHGYRYKGIDETTRLYNHIPMLWLGGAIVSPRRITKICNQSDLAATLLQQLQVSHEDFTFSRDVMSSTYTRQFAYHTYNNGVTVIDSTGFVAYDLDTQNVTASEGSHTEQQLQLARALLQLTSHDLKEK